MMRLASDASSTLLSKSSLAIVQISTQLELSPFRDKL